MKVVPFKRNWCDYLTPCPYLNKDKHPAGIMVGDYGCYSCKYRVNKKKDKYDGHYAVACEYEYICNTK